MIVIVRRKWLTWGTWCGCHAWLCGAAVSALRRWVRLKGVKKALIIDSTTKAPAPVYNQGLRGGKKKQRKQGAGHAAPPVLLQDMPVARDTITIVHKSSHHDAHYHKAHAQPGFKAMTEMGRVAYRVGASW